MVERIAANADKKGSSVSEAAKRCLTNRPENFSGRILLILKERNMTNGKM